MGQESRHTNVVIQVSLRNDWWITKDFSSNLKLVMQTRTVLETIKEINLKCSSLALIVLISETKTKRSVLPLWETASLDPKRLPLSLTMTLLPVFPGPTNIGNKSPKTGLSSLIVQILDRFVVVSNFCNEWDKFLGRLAFSLTLRVILRSISKDSTHPSSSPGINLLTTDEMKNSWPFYLNITNRRLLQRIYSSSTASKLNKIQNVTL